MADKLNLFPFAKINLYWSHPLVSEEKSVIFAEIHLSFPKAAKKACHQVNMSGRFLLETCL